MIASCGDGFVHKNVEECDENNNPLPANMFCTAECNLACTYTQNGAWGDCDNSLGNGCEIALDTPENCGVCMKSCDNDVCKWNGEIYVCD